MATRKKLFAVYLGGRAPKSNSELHDIVFVAGSRVEETYPQLVAQWFGSPEGLHIDSWMELDVVDGHRVRLSSRPGRGLRKLFFVNLGGYREGEIGEIHANGFFVARNRDEAKTRAKAHFAKTPAGRWHADNICEILCCPGVGKAKTLHVVLTPTRRKQNLQAHNGYHPFHI